MINRIKEYLSCFVSTLDDSSYSSVKSLRNDCMPPKGDIQRVNHVPVCWCCKGTRNTTIEQDLTDRSWAEGNQ